jgi:hypothetical protein
VSFIPKHIPVEYRRQFIAELEELERWATANAEDAKRDAIWFWSMKIPAVLASALAGVLGYLDLKVATLVIGAAGSVCVIVDGINPRGVLRNVHVRAVHDLRQLQNEIKETLRYSTNKNLPEFLASLSARIQSEQRRIAEYLREAETALGGARHL